MELKIGFKTPDNDIEIFSRAEFEGSFWKEESLTEKSGLIVDLIS